MVITKQYDFNLWSQDSNELCLTACELEYSTSGTIQTNYDEGHYHTMRFSFPENIEEIEFLLDDLAINHYPFTDYDEWIGDPRLFSSERKLPKSIEDFLKDLPMYEIADKANQANQERIHN